MGLNWTKGPKFVKINLSWPKFTTNCDLIKWLRENKMDWNGSTMTKTKNNLPNHCPDFYYDFNFLFCFKYRQFSRRAKNVFQSHRTHDQWPKLSCLRIQILQNSHLHSKTFENWFLRVAQPWALQYLHKLTPLILSNFHKN